MGESRAPTGIPPSAVASADPSLDALLPRRSRRGVVVGLLALVTAGAAAWWVPTQLRVDLTSTQTYSAVASTPSGLAMAGLANPGIDRPVTLTEVTPIPGVEILDVWVSDSETGVVLGEHGRADWIAEFPDVTPRELPARITAESRVYVLFQVQDCGYLESATPVKVGLASPWGLPGDGVLGTIDFSTFPVCQ